MIKPVILCIMDGWGLAPPTAHNAVFQAHTPHFDRMQKTYPCTSLAASGEAVGLPAGQPGNSEVGHLTIGAGRCVPQDLPRISGACLDGSLAREPIWNAFLDALKKRSAALHLVGLVSEGGVHSHQDHIIALAHHACAKGVPIWMHIITDGRDTLPKQAEYSLPKFLHDLPAQTRIASLSGRYFALDRDQRMHRTEKFRRVLMEGDKVMHAKNALSALKAGYGRGESDEFIHPTCMTEYDGMQAQDGIMFANFRTDRLRQIAKTLFGLEAIAGGKAGKTGGAEAIDGGGAVFSGSALSLTPIDPILAKQIPHIFSPPDLGHGLGACVAAAHLRQIRIAETEKYPHVTYFFNGGQEVAFEGEARHLIPSPKVATYDLQPEMSAAQVCAAALAAIENQQHHLIIINFANPDMVGHTGNLSAAIKAVETIDHAIGKLEQACLKSGGAMVITADHGNCEVMWEEEARQPHTAHTCNLVPCILVQDIYKTGHKNLALKPGGLPDLAPTLLTLLGLKIPPQMTGRSLLDFKDEIG